MTSKSLCFREFPRHCFARLARIREKQPFCQCCGIACGVYAGYVVLTGNSISNEGRSGPTAARTEFRAETDPRVGPCGTATRLPARKALRAGLRPGLSLQLDVAIGEFDGIFNPLAEVLLADLFGLFLHERGEGIEASRDLLPGFLFGGDQDVVGALNLLALGLIDTVQGEMGGRTRSLRCGMAYAVRRMMLGLVFVLLANSLDGKQRVLRPTVTLFPYARLFAPEIAVDGVALRHFVVTVALREIHAAAV